MTEPTPSTSTSPTHLVLRALPIAVVIAVVGAFLAFIFLGSGPPTRFNALDITGSGYADDFQLTDIDGHPRSIADYRGNAVMVFFGFTQCPSACPTELARSAEVMRRLGPSARHVRMLFITIDPERDTPELMRNYLQAFDPSFIGLRGDLAATAATARRFKAFYQKVPAGDTYTMDHSTFTYLFDPKGRIRLLARPDLDAGAIANDLRQLLAG
jgi:protein SCO1/2